MCRLPWRNTALRIVSCAARQKGGIFTFLRCWGHSATPPTEGADLMIATKLIRQIAHPLGSGETTSRSARFAVLVLPQPNHRISSPVGGVNPNGPNSRGM